MIVADRATKTPGRVVSLAAGTVSPNMPLKMSTVSRNAAAGLDVGDSKEFDNDGPWGIGGGR